MRESIRVMKYILRETITRRLNMSGFWLLSNGLSVDAAARGVSLVDKLGWTSVNICRALVSLNIFQNISSAYSLLLCVCVIVKANHTDTSIRYLRYVILFSNIYTARNKYIFKKNIITFLTRITTNFSNFPEISLNLSIVYFFLPFLFLSFLYFLILFFFNLCIFDSTRQRYSYN